MSKSGQRGVESDSKAGISVKASRFEYGVAHTSETLTDEAVSFQAQDPVVVKLTGVKRKGFVSASDADCGENTNLDGSKAEDLYRVAFDGSDLLKKSTDKNVLKDSNASANGNPKLFDSDLVWARVKTYPWWPGQVFDATVGSNMAKEHFKKGKFLVAYFGDSTFAWINASQIKPFHQHFSQMQEQSNSAEFRDAVACALEEVSRRVEFGLSCSCFSEEAYNKLKTQNIINPGIREGSRVRYGGDKLSDARCFKPAKVVEYMRHLACFPSYDTTEELHFVTNRAQLLAFHQWKSCSHFPEYETILRLVEIVPKAAASVMKPNTDEANKRFDFEDKTDEKTKGEKLSDLIVKTSFGSSSTEKLDCKSHSEKKRKFASLETGKSENDIKNNQQKEDSVSHDAANKLQMGAEPCYGIGGESQINSLSPTLKPCSDSSPTTEVEVVENKKTKKTKHEDLVEGEISSHDEMLLSLHSAKTLEKITEWAESISIDPLNYEDFEKYIKELSCSNLIDDLKKASITEISEVCDVKVAEEEQMLPAFKEITGSGSNEQTDHKDCSVDSSAPNALILNFADSGSVPSKEKLKDIFNRYGPLQESKTQVMKKGKRAQVVFKRGEDAKTAFSSSGKYRIFGPSLLSYKLKYVCPKDKESNNMTN